MELADSRPRIIRLPEGQAFVCRSSPMRHLYEQEPA